MADKKPEPKTGETETTAIAPYELKEFAGGGTINFLTKGNVSIPLSIELLSAIVTVKSGDRAPSKTELVMYANSVIEQGCNCYLNECWLVFMRGKYVPVIAAQKRIAKAQSMPSYDGYEWGWIGKDGTRCPSGPENTVKKDEIVGVWGRVHFKNRKVPFYHEIFKEEYPHKNNDRPITMLLKTARDQVHKYAFANEMGNLCTENEVYDERLPVPECNTPPRDGRRRKVESQEVAGTDTEPVVAETDESADTATGFIKTDFSESVVAREKLFAEITDLFNKLGGENFIQFAAEILCRGEDEVDAPEKFTEDMLIQVKQYIVDEGV